MLKNNKGITLIALVITIIVLLILAGVSIAMLTGQNGILTQANTAGTNTRDAEIREAIALAVSTINADLYDSTTNNYTELTYATIAQAVNNDRGANTAVAIGSGTTGGGITYTYGSKKYDAKFTIENNGIKDNSITISEHSDS